MPRMLVIRIYAFTSAVRQTNILDLSSVRLFAYLQNTDGTRAKFLRPLGGLHSFFQRYRATVGGQMVQDIVEYNRHW